jgi:hypothetical protein
MVARPPASKPRLPAYTFSGFRLEEGSTNSSRDTTPTSTRRSSESYDGDESFTIVGTRTINNVELEFAHAPSRFGFEYEVYAAPPTGLDYGARHLSQVVNRILCMADLATRKVCRALCRATKAAIDGDLYIKPSPISYPANADIVHRILDLASHETRLTCRRLCRQIKERLDPQMAVSVTLTSISVQEELCLHITATDKRRIPGLPPQSYDAWDAWKRGRAYANPAILRHTRTLTFASNMGDIVIGNAPVGSINIGVLVPYLNPNTVRDAYPGSQWRNIVPCTKYVTLTLISHGRRRSPHTRRRT